MSKFSKLDRHGADQAQSREHLFSASDQAANLPLDPQPSANLQKVSTEPSEILPKGGRPEIFGAAIADQLPKLVEPFQRMIRRGVENKGFHPVAISHAMMIAGMLELVEAAGKDFTIEILNDMIAALENVDSRKSALQ